MAQRRLINKALGSSTKVLRMYREAGEFANFASFLYVLLMAHSDDYARFKGDVESAMMKVLPAGIMSGIHKPDDYERALQLLHDIGLIQLYEREGVRYLLITNFDREQPGLHKRKKPEYPAPDGSMQGVEDEPKEKEPPDERRAPLIAFADEQWQAYRGCKLQSATSAKDWSQLAKMLKRTKPDSSMTLEALQTSLQNFLGSPDPFDQKQGFAYWCTNVTKYVNPALVIKMPRRIAPNKPIKCNYCNDTGRFIRVRDECGSTRSIMPWSEDAELAPGAEINRCTCKAAQQVTDIEMMEASVQ